MEFFTVEKITATTTKITDLTGVAAYLVEGSERAALIDTATGAGDLKGLVGTLTPKPVEVILTHGHCDHAGGAAPFGKVFLSEHDWGLVRHHASMEMKRDYVRFILGDEGYSSIPEDGFAPERDGGYLPIRDGQTWELGGVTLEAVPVPGHTQGMTCILNREERTILFGDACNLNVFLWDTESSTVEEYRSSLLELKKQEKRYDTVYLSHDRTTVDKGILDGVIAVCDEILAGTNDWQPFEFMGNPLRAAKRQDARLQRVDGGLGNIVYHPGKIHSLKWRQGKG